MLVALSLPRLPLQVALIRAPQPVGMPVAVGPPPFGEPRLGTPSMAAEASGVRLGMSLTEALTLCPDLVLVPPDPAGVLAWGRRLVEGVDALGLPVEEISPGRVLVDADPGLRLHGGPRELLRKLAEIADGLQIGAAPVRFAALMASRLARRRPRILAHGDLADALGPLPVRLLHEDGDVPEEICTALALVGIDRLGGLASLQRIAVRDRFGAAGLEAWRMARGEDGCDLRPLRPTTPITAVLTPGAPVATDDALERAVALLLEQALADPARAGREPRLVELEAQLITGESWLASAPLREPCSDHQRLCMALMAKARRLPAPAERLRVTLTGLSPSLRQLTLLDSAGRERERRLTEATDQVRTTLGQAAMLRVVAVDPSSRLPEQRYGLSER